MGPESAAMIEVLPLQFKADISLIVDHKLHIADMALDELPLFSSAHADAGGAQSLLHHGIHIEMKRAVQIAEQFFEQCSFFDVLGVAGIKVVYVAKENAGIHEGFFYVGAALNALHHDKESRICQ